MAREEDILQRIVLEGDKVILKQFADIARAGDQAFKRIQESAQAATRGGAFPALVAALSNVRRSFTEIGRAGSEVVNSLGNVGTAATRSARNVTILTASIAALALGFTGLIKAGSDVGDNIAKNAAALGLTTKAYQEFSFVAGQAGVDQAQFDGSMGRFIRTLDGTGKSQEDFNKGIAAARREWILGRTTLEDFNKTVDDLRFQMTQAENPLKDLGVEIARTAEGGIDARETFLRLSDSVAQSDDPVKTTAKTFEIFGRGAARMTGFLRMGREEIEKMSTGANRLGIVINEGVLKRQEELNDALDAVNKAWTATRQNMLAAFSPTLVRLLNALVEAEARWRAGSIVTATTLANRVVPIVDQFIALLEGRDADIQGSIVIRIRDAVVNTATAVQRAFVNVIIPAFEATLRVLDLFAAAINGIFGTELTGGVIIATAVLLKLTGTLGLVVAAFKAAFAIVGLLATALGGPLALALAAVAALIGFVLVRALQRVNWSDFASRAQAAFNAVAGVGRSTINLLVAAWQGFTSFLATVWNGVTALARNTWNGIVVIVQSVIAGITALVTDFRGTISGIWTAIAEEARQTWEGLGILAQIAVLLIQTAWQGLAGFLSGIWETVRSGATSAWTWVSDQATVAVNYISGIFSGLRDNIIQSFTSIRDFILETWNRVKGAIAAMSGGGGGGSTAEATGFARGGHVRGPGSGTSDSVPIWASAGEYVVRAKAVRKYGVGLLHALNGLKIDPKQFKFAAGGLVQSLSFDPAALRDAMQGIISFDAPRMQPRMAYADGGMVRGGGNVLNLSIDGQRFEGLNADEDTFGALQKYAAKRSLRSAGRKPTWHRG